MPATALSHMLDPASEDEFARSDADMLLTPDSAVENIAPSKRKVGRPTTKGAVHNNTITKTTKTRAPSRRTSGASVLGAKKGATSKSKRTALAEKTNLGNASDTEEVDDFELGGSDGDRDMERTREGAQEAPAKPKRGRPKKAKGNEVEADTTNGKKGARAEDDEQTITPDVARQSRLAPRAAPGVKRPKVSKRAPSVEPAKVIPETQPEPMDITETQEEKEVLEPTPRLAARTANRARSVSKQRQPLIPHRRAGSASDTERAGSDPVLRRKLGDMTKRFENLELKYRDLREVGVKDADSNFEKLRRSTEQRTRDQDDVIASLKKELAAQKSLASESKSLRAQLSTLTTEVTRLTSENKSLSTSLHDAQNEIKSLSTKLAATRSAASVEAPGTKVPGSAVKRTAATAAPSEAVKEAHMMKLKEDLYSDLTGLILRGVKRLDGEDVYDCIQTGRNGTLHFHLSISTAPTSANSGNNGKPISSSSYEDAEFAYTPLLDEKNDRDLLEILPDYLTEEICFPRSSAAKFYAKVVDCMTKKIVVEEEG